MHINRFVPYLFLLLVACASDKQIPINPGSSSGNAGMPALPSGGVVISTDAFVPLEPDMAVVDASTPDATAPLEPDASNPSQMVPDYVTDIASDVVPAQDSYAVLGGGDFTRMVYWRGGRLLSRTFTLKIDAPDGEMVPNLGAIDPARIRVDQGSIELVGYRPPAENGGMDGRLSGIMPASGSDGQAGWALASEGADDKVIAYSLDALESDPIETGLYGAVRSAGYAYGSSIANHGLVIGRTGAESDSSIGYAILTEENGPLVSIPTRNHPLPSDIRVAGPNWVFAFDDGMCLTMQASEAGPSKEIGMWRCNTGPKSRLLGGGGIGDTPIGIYAAMEGKERLLAWDPRPGQNISPASAVISEMPPAMGGMNAPGGADGAGGLVGGASAGGQDGSGGMVAGAASDNMPMESPTADVQDGIVVLGRSKSTVDWLNEVPSGRVASVSGVDGRKIYVFDKDGVLTMTSPVPDHFLGVIQGTAQTFFAIRWETTTGVPVAEPVEFERLAQAPEGSGAICVNQVRAPEVCDESIDNDCDGRVRAPLCCVNTPLTYSDAKFDLGSPVTGDWFLLGPITGSAGSSDEAKEQTGYFAFADRVEYRTIKKGQPGTCYGCFADIKTLKTATRQGTVSGAIAEAAFQNDGISTCPQTCPSAVPIPRDPPMGGAVGEPATGGQMGGQTAGADGAGGAPGGMVAGAVALSGGAAAGDANNPGEDNVRSLILLHYESIGSTIDTGTVEIVDAPCARPEALHISRDAGGFTVHVLCLSAHFGLRIDLDGSTYRRAEEFVETPYARGAVQWIGHPVKRIEGGQSITYISAASGDDYALDLYKIGPDGFQNIALPPSYAELASAPSESRSLPIRVDSDIDIYPSRIVDDRWLEVFVSNQGWTRSPSRRFVRKLYLSAWDPLAFSLAEYNDPTAPGFDAVFQELVLYHHSLKTTEMHWGRLLNESQFREKQIEFQGMNIADFPPQNDMVPRHTFDRPPILWWARGREGVAPSARTIGLDCE